ncbi:hypothetical protein CAEBREN_24073 [Caenorhabditis brenneri]|uniref:Uncharacterized protein n=1 Tax=Caenorhabditis brenneri TaxID=135651 RepID=G0PBL1_CAEBE|nr:hypothetical protein CAEBREN_24073 [Caenorhabditis brenneri]
MELFNIFEAPGAVSDKNAHKEYIKLLARLQVQQRNQVKAGFIHVVPRETFGTRWVMQCKEMVANETKVIGILKTATREKGQNPKVGCVLKLAPWHFATVIMTFRNLTHRGAPKSLEI